MKEERGYVIRCLNGVTGAVYYLGKVRSGALTTVKESLELNETFTLRGAKHRLKDLQENSILGNNCFYSIEKLSYENPLDMLNEEKIQEIEDKLQIEILECAHHSLKRLQELRDKNDFDNSDKMRIKEIKNDLRRILEILNPS